MCKGGRTSFPSLFSLPIQPGGHVISRREAPKCGSADKRSASWINVSEIYYEMAEFFKDTWKDGRKETKLWETGLIR